MSAPTSTTSKPLTDPLKRRLSKHEKAMVVRMHRVFLAEAGIDRLDDTTCFATHAFPDGSHTVVCDLREIAVSGLLPEDGNFRVVAYIAPNGQLRLSVPSLRDGTAYELPMHFLGRRVARNEHPVNPFDTVLGAVRCPGQYAYHTARLLDPTFESKPWAEREPIMRQLEAWPKPEGSEGMWMAILHRQARNLYNAMWRRIEPFLHPEAYAICRARRYDGLVYDWLVRSPTLLDVARVAPGLFGAYVQAIRVAGPRGEVLYSEAPPGLTLRTVAAHLIPLAQWQPSAAFMRWARLAHLTPPYCPPSHMDVAQNVALMDRQGMLDVNHLSNLRTAKDWYTFHCLADLPVLARAFLRDPTAGHAALAPRLAQSRDPKVMRLREVGRSVIDTLNGLYHQQVGIRQAGNDHRPYMAWSVARFLREDREYHQRFVREMQQQRLQPRPAEVVRPEDDTPFPTPRVTRIETPDLLIQWLDRPSLLAAEGAAMGHCVRTYAHVCRRGTSVIYSVATPAGDRIATMEVTRPQYTILQLQGERNRPLPEEQRRAIREALATALRDAPADTFVPERRPDYIAPVHDFDDLFANEPADHLLLF